MVGLFAKGTLVIVSAGIVIVLVLYGVGFIDRCSFEQIDVTNGIKKYEETKDPQLCESLNKKILQFNNECKSNLEEFDCG